MKPSTIKRRRRLVAWVGETATIVELGVKCLIVVGSIAAVVQYFEVKHEKRVERTLAYATQFEQDPERSAQRTLTAIFRDQHQTAANLSRAGIDQAGARAEELRFVDYLHSGANGTGAEEEIDTLVSFMDDVNTCAREHLCDERVVLDHFGEFADQFSSNLHYYIGSVRSQGAPRYASGVEDLARRYRAER